MFQDDFFSRKWTDAENWVLRIIAALIVPFVIWLAIQTFNILPIGKYDVSKLDGYWLVDDLPDNQAVLVNVNGNNVQWSYSTEECCDHIFTGVFKNGEVKGNMRRTHNTCEKPELRKITFDIVMRFTDQRNLVVEYLPRTLGCGVIGKSTQIWKKV